MIAAPQSTRPPARNTRNRGPILALAIAVVGVLAYLLGARFGTPQEGSTHSAARPSATLVTAIREVARLETTQLHVEKVIDLADTQSRFFGLVQATDAVLLVASGDVIVGIDLGKLGDGDVSIDANTKRATIRLPPPEILSASLDEKRTYVYTRSTGLLAQRNEQLEARARQEAVNAIEAAARQDDVMERAKRQAERELRSIALGLGASDVSVVWR